MKEIIIVAKMYEDIIDFEVITLDNWKAIDVYKCVSLQKQLHTSQLKDDVIYYGDLIVIKAMVEPRILRIIEDAFDFYDNGMPAYFLSKGCPLYDDILSAYKSALK